MSQSSPPNPYASPTAPPPIASQTIPSAFKPIDRIEYMRMYNYVFENPDWMMTVLLSALCLLIPVIGPLVLVGYQYEVVLGLLATQGLKYPSFDFNRFADYLMRGVWPFLVQLVASVVLAPVLVVAALVLMLILGGIASAVGDDGAPFVFGIGMPIVVIGIFAMSMMLTIVMLPLMLRSALAQDFAEGFNFNWAMDFFRKTWRDLLVAVLFLSATGAVLALLGVLACYIGLFVVMPVIFLAQAHLVYQVYGMFLTRGGAPVPVKLAAPVPMGPPPGYAPPK